MGVVVRGADSPSRSIAEGPRLANRTDNCIQKWSGVCYA